MLKLPTATGRPHSDLLAVQRIVYAHPSFVIDNTLSGDEKDFVGLPLEMEQRFEPMELKLALAMRKCCQRLDYPARIAVLVGPGPEDFLLEVKCFCWMLGAKRNQLLLASQIPQRIAAISGWNPQEPWSFLGELQ